MRIIVIGGVAAGMSAAARARRNIKDAEIVVFEQGDVVSFGACGLPYFAGGWFDYPSEMIARTPEKFRDSGIDVRLHQRVIGLHYAARKIRVKDLDTGSETDESFDQLLIATGASPVLPPFPGMNLKNIMTLTKLKDGEILKSALKDPAVKDIVVVEAGFIGIETVEACLHMGK